MNPNGELKIEKGIPIPEGVGSGCIATLRAMKIGDSFLFPLSKRTSISGQAMRAGVKIITRAVDGKQVRVWRIA